MTAVLKIVLSRFATTEVVSDLMAGRFPAAGRTGVWEVFRQSQPVSTAEVEAAEERLGGAN
jgi:hypothetical protein